MLIYFLRGFLPSSPVGIFDVIAVTQDKSPGFGDALDGLKPGGTGIQ
jgi:hypothetical protein